ncbi:MAG: lamin tail domain-containing protein [Candidatus Izimaplasma sp.]|nr:lamin tail domain-containing protein [Candidatus Izimaplasma bacterium]
MKRIFLPFLLIFSLLILVSCGEDEAVLPDLTDKNRTEIASVLDELNINYSFEEELNNEITEDYFIRYGNDLSTGNKVSLEQEVIVVVAINDPMLPDLSGESRTEIITILDDLGINYSIEEELNNDINEDYFIRYGNDLTAGDRISSEQEVIVVVAINDPILPDLSGENKLDIRTILNDLGIDYEFQYETNDAQAEDVFIRYGDDYNSGDFVSADEVITVIISTEDLVLPNLEGLTESEIFDVLLGKQITNFTYEIVTDNTVEDKTFVGYGDGLEAGDTVSDRFTFTIIIGYNSETMPDLDGMLLREISLLLDDKNISYEFEYVTNDDYPEDSFAGYKDYEVGDFYQEDVVTVYLFENTFTEAETSLFISSYIDGGNDNSNRAIEIYNPTDSAIDLNDYHLVIYSNGSYDVTYRIDFDEVDLLPGEVYVIAHEDSEATILAETDLSSVDLLFDGNDTIQLRYKNDTYIDTIYQIGNRDFVMNDEVFVRNPDVQVGSRSYVFNEWVGFVPDYHEVLGAHPTDIPEKIEFVFIPREFDHELGGMTEVELLSINDGDTAGFTEGFDGAERVRFLGVDTPETYPVVDDWGLEAKAYTTLILNYAKNNNKTIYIQSDPEQGYTETYGRHLGLIWIDLGTDVLTVEIKNSDDVVVRTEDLTGVILLNYHLVLNGFSYNYFSSDSLLVYNERYLYRWFQEAQRFAEENNLGIHE